MANKKDAELLVDITKPILEDSDEVTKEIKYGIFLKLTS